MTSRTASACVSYLYMCVTCDRVLNGIILCMGILFFSVLHDAHDDDWDCPVGIFQYAGNREHDLSVAFGSHSISTSTISHALVVGHGRHVVCVLICTAVCFVRNSGSIMHVKDCRRRCMMIPDFQLGSRLQ